MDSHYFCRMQEFEGILKIFEGTHFTKEETEAHRNMYQIPRIAKSRFYNVCK